MFKYNQLHSTPLCTSWTHADDAWTSNLAVGALDGRRHKSKIKKLWNGQRGGGEERSKQRSRTATINEQLSNISVYTNTLKPQILTILDEAFFFSFLPSFNYFLFCLFLAFASWISGRGLHLQLISALERPEVMANGRSAR